MTDNRRTVALAVDDRPNVVRPNATRRPLTGDMFDEVSALAPYAVDFVVAAAAATVTRRRIRKRRNHGKRHP